MLGPRGGGWAVANSSLSSERDIDEDNATLIYANGASDGAVNTIMVVNDIKNAVNAIARQDGFTNRSSEINVACAIFPDQACRR